MDKPTNQRSAFSRLANLTPAYFYDEDPVVRNYHGVRNEFHENTSGLKRQYNYLLIDGEIGKVLKARCIAIAEA
jgi:tRNA U38,U39,U40 pseudouridine synthase TruA